jgi:hypothetical protein
LEEYMAPRLDEDEARAVRQTVLRLNARAWGLAVGLLLGGSLLLATLVLVAKGGPHPGRHLGLLAVYFPGYRVTVAGAFIGFMYAFVVGYGLGRVIGAVYNWSLTPSRGSPGGPRSRDD